METNTLLTLSPAQLRRAAELKEQIDGLNAELAQLLGGSHIGNGLSASSGTDSSGGKRGRRQMSAAGRARIAAAARARWANVKASGGSSLSPDTKGAGKGKKRTMSPAARAKIAAAAKARWAKIRASKG